MYFKELIESEFKDIQLLILVDMDGVIADYEFGRELNFKDKRPIKTNIKTLEELSKLKNIELAILSICKHDKEIEEKNIWLDKYALFITKRNIISKEGKDESSKELKADFLKKIQKESNKVIVLIDDDNGILKYLKKEVPEIILFQDSSIID